MGHQLLLGSGIIVATVVFHVTGLVVLASLLRKLPSPRARRRSHREAILPLALAVMFIIGIHTVEAWSWAAIYLALGEFDNLTQALYFSVVTSTTLGYGDLTLSENWQLLGTFEAMGGLILFGASTAFLMGLIADLFKVRGD